MGSTSPSNPDEPHEGMYDRLILVVVRDENANVERSCRYRSHWLVTPASAELAARRAAIVISVAWQRPFWASMTGQAGGGKRLSCDDYSIWSVGASGPGVAFVGGQPQQVSHEVRSTCHVSEQDHSRQERSRSTRCQMPMLARPSTTVRTRATAFGACDSAWDITAFSRSRAFATSP